ncbi:class II aldolase/adducin family protein [Tropicimonas sp. IMCC6043]|uniref:class II aldolase/adducin family protein n=1 Tax=Tropicimonas sp. IMCC6043 TaxID=2510645 RepID=UPI00101CF465|nr:class II aldolase/adducin family protein [Tropicimonas sp. IMCC6043]RYH07845.1 class II aldolase/adducin family protein [Tropicimonas sp. IMCC6043]
MSDTLDQADILAKKDELIATAKRSFEVGIQTNAGGNLSVCLDSREAIVIKPSGVGFNECTRENLQVVLMDGTVLPSEVELKPSKDLEFHLEIYRRRADISAIVHCHSPWATGYASAGLEVPCLTVQTVEKIGRMPLVPLTDNLGPQTAAMIGPVFDDPKIRAAVLANHGAIGTGKTLKAAQYLAEIIEETAHIAFVRDTLVRSLGLKTPPSPEYGTAMDERAALERA